MIRWSRRLRFPQRLSWVPQLQLRNPWSKTLMVQPRRQTSTKICEFLPGRPSKSLKTARLHPARHVISRDFFFKNFFSCLSLILLLYSLVGCSCPLKRLYCLCILNHICLILKRKRKFENLNHRVRRPRARHVISRKFSPNFSLFSFFGGKSLFNS